MQRVTFEYQYRTHTGIIQTAHNYGTTDRPDWYIEFIDDKRGACYLKQQADGLQDVEIIITEENEQAAK